MAKSKVGGTRAYIRGRVGSDVYSIGKTGAGKKQQVVRSLAEQVKNPQTLAQMRGRMIMSTVMQAVSAMATIIDHSFDAYPVGQPNISAFIKENYALIKADVDTNPATGNAFGLNKYQEKGIKLGAWLISQGQAAGLPAAAAVLSASALTITLGSDITVGGLKSALNLGADDYFTLCAIPEAGQFVYVRVNINKSLADTETIAAGNIASLFVFDGNVDVTPALNGSTITLTPAVFGANNGIIVSRKESSAYKHSTCVLAAPADPEWTASVALATYPEGSQRFLNGGEESFSPAPTPTPTPSEGKILTISSASGISSVNVLANGVAVQSGAEVASGAALSISGVVAESGYHMEATLNGNAVTLTKNGTTYSGSAVMPNANATLALTKVADSQPTPSADTLTLNGASREIGSTSETDANSSCDVVLTLAEGSSRIGKMWTYGQNQAPAGELATLVQGANTLSIPSSYNTAGKNYQIILGSSDGEEFYFTENLLTISVVDGGDGN